MATYSAGVALAFTYEVADGTTGSYTPGGDDRAVFGTIVCGGFSGLPSITELRYGGSTGTVIDRVGSDLSWVGGNGSHGVFAEAPGPTGSTTLFGDWAGNPLQSAIAALHYSGVDQTTPFSGHVDATPTFANAVTTTVASVTVTGCTAGQTIVAAVGALSDGVVLSAFTAVSGTTLRVSDVTGTFVGVAMLEKVATGSSETLSVNVNGASSAGLYWTARGARVNDAAASGATGTVAYTNANDTSSASGTTTVTGTVSRTNAADTSAASGTTTVTGTLARTNANDTCAASGSIGTAITGTLARTNANDTSAASGTTTVTGTLARTNANDSSSASGTTTVTGTVARTNANDTATASGTAGTPTGTVAYTNRNDTVSAQGSTPQQTTGAPGGRPWIAYINGRRVVGDYWQIKAMIEELAEENAEEEAEGEKPVKKPRIVVQPGKEVSAPAIPQVQGKQIQAEIRQAYNIAYAKAKLALEQEDEEEALMMIL